MPQLKEVFEFEKRRMENGALENKNDAASIGNALNSYCGVMSHGRNYNVRKKMLLDRHRFTRYGLFNLDVHRFVPCLKR